MMTIKSILQRYELQSGQAINLPKSGIYFSSNVRLDKQEELKNIVGVYNDLSSGKYLGLPSLIGRSKKMVFNYLKDRLWNKIQGWSAKCLSKAGKAILLRTVAQAIPSYAMSCFMLPKTLCNDLEKMMNSYWWGSQNNNGKDIKWASWTNMSMAKESGGLAFRDLQGFNIALLGKQCWNLLNNPCSLVVRVFKARYYPDTSLFAASRGGGVSFVWSGLWQAKAFW
ncbi:putative mitochondrial protein AtMg00310 [Apium graveolens]|uniref:putative mitochondrial protein AtMg00310 n=1 Tax=Apium graveolens TaxID=4045 RepID=UPI003D7B383E